MRHYWTIRTIAAVAAIMVLAVSALSLVHDSLEMGYGILLSLASLAFMGIFAIIGAAYGLWIVETDMERRTGQHIDVINKVANPNPAKRFTSRQRAMSALSMVAAHMLLTGLIIFASGRASTAALLIAITSAWVLAGIVISIVREEIGIERVHQANIWKVIEMYKGASA